MEIGKKYDGWFFVCRRRDTFIITDRKAKTKSFLSKICRELSLPDNESVHDSLRWNLRKGTIRIVQLSNGRQYYEMSGDNWGGCGNFLDTKKDIVIEIK